MRLKPAVWSVVLGAMAGVIIGAVAGWAVDRPSVHVRAYAEPIYEGQVRGEPIDDVLFLPPWERIDEVAGGPGGE
ncbi:MAG: hypothetical protein GF320_21760 [Armatimonadia bacterium]|nr:hypothetical protein [Armatimonadia bacterium]